MNKDLKPYIAAALRAGWKVKRTKSGVLLIPPEKTNRSVAIHHGQSIRGCSLANLRQQLREGGLKI